MKLIPILYFVKLHINVYCTPKLVVYKIEDYVYVNTRYNDITRLLC